jgi:NADH:ubiquinone oxidoreductase subunit E
MEHDITKIREVISRSPADPGSLIAVLQNIQREFHYLPCEALKETADILHVPLSKVFSASTFYNAFSLTPRGENIVRVCQGTACHIRGADQLLDQLEVGLQIKKGQTTPDMKFTLEVVNCVGACAMAPVMIVNEKYHANVRCDRAMRLAKKG